VVEFWVASSLALTENWVDDHTFASLRFVSILIVHFSIALACTPLAHLSFRKGALLEVEAKMVATHLAVRSLASGVRLLAFTDSMPCLVTQPTLVERSLRCSVVLGGAAGMPKPPNIDSLPQPFDYGHVVLCFDVGGLKVVSFRILRYPRDVGLIESSLQLVGTCEIEKGGLHVRWDVGCLHALLCGFELDDHLAGLVIKVLLELVDGIRKLLHSLGKLGIDWDACDQCAKLSDFGQDTGVFQTFEHLLDGEVEGHITHKHIKALFFVCDRLLSLLRCSIQFPGKLGMPNALASQFKQDAVVHAVPNEWALNSLALVHGSVP